MSGENGKVPYSVSKPLKMSVFAIEFFIDTCYHIHKKD